MVGSEYTVCPMCGGEDGQGCYKDCQSEELPRLRAENERLRAALGADAQTLRLHLGEMTAQEMRTLKAGFAWVLSRAALAAREDECERMRAALEDPISEDEHIWIYERAAAMFRDWSRAGVRGQKIHPQDGIEYWTALATRECLIARAALATQPQQKERT